MGDLSGNKEMDLSFATNYHPISQSYNPYPMYYQYSVPYYQYQHHHPFYQEHSLENAPYLLCFDTELTGPNMKIHALVGIGAVLSDPKTNGIIKSFQQWINVPENKGWDLDTEISFWKKHKNLREFYENIKLNNYIDIKDAIFLFVEFLNKCYAETNGNLILITNRSDVDCSWINYYLTEFGYDPLHLIFGKHCRVVDTNSYHQGVANFTHLDVNNFEKTMKTRYNCNISAFEYLGVSYRPRTDYNHQPVNDSAYIAECHNIVLKKLNRKKIEDMKSIGNVYRGMNDKNYYPKQNFLLKDFIVDPKAKIKRK